MAKGKYKSYNDADWRAAGGERGEVGDSRLRIQYSNELGCWSEDSVPHLVKGEVNQRAERIVNDIGIAG